MKSETTRYRWIAVAAVTISIGVLALLAYGNIGENLVYYWSPSEVHEAGDRAVGASIRLGGLVAPGTIVRGEDGLTLDFEVTDGKTNIPIRAEAVPPAMFREGVGVVVEGTMRSDGRFETRRLMVKHDNQYRAPGEGESVDMEAMMKSMQFEDG